MKGTELNHPNIKTWFICWDKTRETVKSCGVILPSQCMKTPYDEVDYYEDQLLWGAVLSEEGIDYIYDNN
jgi:hypothetical protein